MADKDGKVWAKIAPSEYSDTQATFDYIDIIEAYGTANFEKVSAISIGDSGFCKLKCTGITITNCTDKGTHKIDQAQSSSETEEVSQTVSEPAEEAVSSAAEAAAPVQPQNNSGSGNSNIVFIIVGIVSGIALAVGVIVIIMNKKAAQPTM